MGRRSERFRIRREDAISTKEKNLGRKTKERARRDGRMKARLASGRLPYTPEVMSWLSATLGKKTGQITDQDVSTLVRGG